MESVESGSATMADLAGVMLKSGNRPQSSLPSSGDALFKGSSGESPSSIISGCLDSESDIDSNRSFQHLLATEEDEDNERMAEDRAVNSTAVRSGSAACGSFAERLAARRVDPVGALRPSTARFKTVPPSRLQSITRACVTIPPGLSPTTLLDSPVLLPTSQAEPSPTTGTYPLPPFLDGVSLHAVIRPPPSLAPDSVRDKSAEQGNSAGAINFKPFYKLQRTSLLSGPGRHPSIAQESFLASASIGHQQSIYPLAQVSGATLLPIQLSVPEQVQPQVAGAAANPLPAEVATSEVSPQAAVPMDLQSKPGESEQHTGEAEQHGHVPQTSITTFVERPSEDGYNWRKYGQKQVKGSEYPRSYYKCTQPNCPMKKKVERSHDGQVTEIIYKGDHNHQRPLPTRRLSVAVGAVNLTIDGDKSDVPDAWGGFQNGGVGDGIGKPERDGGRQLSVLGCATGTPEPSSSSTSDGDDDEDGDSKDDGSLNDEEREARRMRKRERRAREREAAAQIAAAPQPRINREPRVVVQTTSEVDILDDGYRWRKYGRKVVKGNPHPRNYYKCTNMGCTVRKHVERASNDPRSVITTYEGKHNHDVPAARNSGGGNHDSALTGGAVAPPQSATIPAAAASLQDQGSRFSRRSGSFGGLEDRSRKMDSGRSILGMELRSREHGGSGDVSVLTSIPMSLALHNSEGGGVGRPPLSMEILEGRMDFTRPKQEQADECNADKSSSQQQRLSAANGSFHQNLPPRLVLGP